ncbi:MAG: hypothetical protein IRZ16_11740 [Myxococcaceae bacterium]|nr:hypothetical protein [Myxococcaceae bacterium]
MERFARIGLVSVLALAAAACQDRTTTRRVHEDFAIVPGTPQVEVGAPGAEVDPTRATDDFRINTPRQCDLFQQLSVRKVDILWIVDSSGSMAPKQQRLAQNFQGFINQLVSAQPPIDFHIAVTTTDTDDPATRGTLRTWSVGNKSGNFIACTPDVTGTVSTCNTGSGSTADAVTAFAQMAQVGTQGSASEKGLLNAYLTLENPANLGPDRFVRPDAALYVVVVSDEDDSSCNPLVKQPICTADPGCRCAADGTLSGSGAYGATSYFSRYLETYKGYGRQDLVALAAIVALDGDEDAGIPSQFGDPSQHVGCCRNLVNPGEPCPKGGVNDGGYEVAYFGSRYLQVASDTGGVAVNICDDDFSNALASLGYAASGLRREFRLTRGPELKPMGGIASGVELYVSPANAANCTVDGNCPNPGEVCRSGRCAVRVPVSIGAAPNGAQYVKCDASTFRNVIRFDGTAVPESLSTVEVCYDVAPEFQNTCL